MAAFIIFALCCGIVLALCRHAKLYAYTQKLEKTVTRIRGEREAEKRRGNKWCAKHWKLADNVLGAQREITAALEQVRSVSATLSGCSHAVNNATECLMSSDAWLKNKTEEEQHGTED